MSFRVVPPFPAVVNASAFQAVDVDQVDMIFGMHEECNEGDGCLLGKILPLQVKI